MRYSVPIQYNMNGWVEVEANSPSDARRKLKAMEIEGIDPADIRDCDTSVELSFEMMEKVYRP